ncbi:MAG: cysteine synthase A [Bacillati bacterium ANGP1]|uniref:cysteine synthase n=1 Tax=Candidatus Segetimicrobium genomatis TaxID=2569760 RepID=A0A537JAM8_9BACT|nr:MAG: cysteine synthase A [Terrabacteria group bacterium ANGP1]
MDWERRRRPAESIVDTAGLTPLVRLRRVVGDTPAAVFGKLEYFGPSGSVKDRILPFIVEEAERRGDLRPGMILIEGTTGNTGIATAMVGAVKGYRVIIVMPEGMSRERQKAIQAYGAELVLTPGSESDVDLVLEKVLELKARWGNQMWEVGQFTNPDNVRAHQRSTGPEIWEQSDGRVDAFVASQGTGGTLTGVSAYLKERKPEVLSFAVEPAECAILSGRGWGSHRIEGIGDGFIPDVLDLRWIDGVVTVSSDDAIAMARRLAREEGIFCGISSGCNVVACLKVSRAYPALRAIVTMINDNGLRYLSTELGGEHQNDQALPSTARGRATRPQDARRLAGKRLVVLD